MKTGKGCALLELWHSGIDNTVEAEVAPQSPRDSGWAFEYIVGAVPRVLVFFLAIFSCIMVYRTKVPSVFMAVPDTALSEVEISAKN